MERYNSTTKSPSNRSRLTNGSALFLGEVDGRSASARRWRDLYEDLTGALGGEGVLSTVHIQLCRRSVTLAVLLEDMESAIATKGNGTGGNCDPDLADRYIKASGALLRVLRSLGLDVTVQPGEDDVLSLEAYLSAKARKSHRKTLKDRIITVSR